jgi:hypothetical protein
VAMVNCLEVLHALFAFFKKLLRGMSKYEGLVVFVFLVEAIILLITERKTVKKHMTLVFNDVCPTKE